jgi:hypothetical protein
MPSYEVSIDWTAVSKPDPKVCTSRSTTRPAVLYVVSMRLPAGSVERITSPSALQLCLEVRSAADWPDDWAGLIVSRSRCPVAIALPSVAPTHRRFVGPWRTT